MSKRKSFALALTLALGITGSLAIETNAQPSGIARAGNKITAAGKTGEPAIAKRGVKPSQGSREKYTTIINRYASAYGVPQPLARAIVRIESNYRPNTRGKAGEIGLMQIKLSTARLMGYSGSAKGLYDPETNIKYGMKYLGKAHELGGGTTCGTVLKYNAGHGARHMNPVSARYCAKVKQHLARS